MLKREPSLTQRWQFNGWNGTPRQLADAARKIRNLLPEGKFRAAVTETHGPVLVTDEPEGLREIPPETQFDTIDIDINEHRPRPGEEYGSDHHFVTLRFGRTSSFNNSVACHTLDELQSRAMLQGIKDALTPGIPPHVRGKHARGRHTAKVLGVMLVVSAGVGVIVGVVTDDLLWGYLAGSLTALVVFNPVYNTVEWLFPAFELYTEKPRRRRFLWGIVTLVLIPIVVGLALAFVQF